MAGGQQGWDDTRERSKSAVDAPDAVQSAISSFYALHLCNVCFVRQVGTAGAN